MNDPYKLLGVSRSASDDDIKKAYKSLSRKYHPDANINNPNKEQAEDKFKEIQQAYTQIMNERKHGYDGNGGYSDGNYDNGGFGDFGGFGNFGGFGGFGGAYGNSSSSSNMNEEDMHLKAAANYINSQHYAEALNVLNSINNRTSKWYYYSAIANNGVGNNILALEHARLALSMEPDNYQYRQLVSTLEGGGQWYNSRQQEFGGTPSFMCSNPCLTCCILNSLCNACCFGCR